MISPEDGTFFTNIINVGVHFLSEFYRRHQQISMIYYIPAQKKNHTNIVPCFFVILSTV